MSPPEIPLLKLDIVSDIVCPWCYIGKARLQRALPEIDPSISIAVRWLPFELNPTLPADGMPRAEYCERKFGSVERANQLYARVAAAARQDGLAIAVERIARTPNTRAAHVLIALAEEAGLQDAIVDALFKAYFVDGRDIGDTTTLAEIATAAGLSVEQLAAALTDPARLGAIAAFEQAADEQGVTGVPSFLVNGRLLFSGAQDPITIARSLERAYQRRL